MALKEIEVLELLENYLLLNNDPKVIEEFIETLREKKRRKEADQLELVLDEIKRKGKGIVKVLYEYGLIKEDTYQYLEALEHSSMLEADLVKELKEQKDYLAKIDKELRGMLYQPMLSIISTFLVGVGLDKQAFNMYKSTNISPPDWVIAYKVLIDYPYVAIPIAIVVLIILTYFLSKWFINIQIEKEVKLYKISSIAYILTKAKQPLKFIFELLAEFEKSRKWKALFIEIAERYAESFREQVRPLLKFFDGLTEIRFILTAERDEALAWKFLKERSKEDMRFKIEKIKTTFSAIVSFLPWIIIMLIALPFFSAILSFVSKTNF